MNIHAQFEEISAALAYWNRRLQALQATCLHPSAQKVNRANTGNYDPSADRYWRDCTCPDCGKVWTEDQ